MSWEEKLSELPRSSYEYVWRGGGGEVEEEEYTVISVAVITLWLIILVELFRHYLENLATDRPFFKTVLDGIYRELATLGLVEFFLLMIGTYSTINFPTFGRVHLALTVTAIMQSIQSVMIAVLTIRQSKKLWVKTEYQDLHFYVELREEFDRIEKKFEKWTIRNIELLTGSSLEANSGNMHQLEVERLWSNTGNEDRYWFQYWIQFFSEAVRGLWRSVRYPVLARKHHELLVQLRFHELKFHFIKSNNLPLTLRVSEYLERSELNILKKLVHISTFAWLLLTGVFDLFYFLLGMITYIEGESEGRRLGEDKIDDYVYSDKYSYDCSGDPIFTTNVLTNVLLWSFVAVNILFIVISITIHGKMYKIFLKIIRKKPEEKENFNQRSLFWGENPNYITTMIQFMSFGFSVGWSVLLIFFPEICNDNCEGSCLRSRRLLFLLGILLICNFAFVTLMSHVIPRFTLCSSMGQLVDQRQLDETVARHTLEVKQREREQMLAHEKFDFDIMIDNESKQEKTNLFKRLVEKKSSNKLRTILDDEEKRSNQEVARRRRRYTRTKSKSEGVLAMQSMGKEENNFMFSETYLSSPANSRSQLPQAMNLEKDANTITTSLERGDRRSRRQKSVSASANIQMMHEAYLREMLVKTNTEELRDKLPEDERDKLFKRESKLRRGGSERRKLTLSDGVAEMRSLGENEIMPSENPKNTNQSRRLSEDRKQRRRNARKKTVSDGVLAMCRLNETDNPSFKRETKISSTVQSMDLHGKISPHSVPEVKSSTSFSKSEVMHSQDQSSMVTESTKDTEIVTNFKVLEDQDKTEMDSYDSGYKSDDDDIPAMSEREIEIRKNDKVPKIPYTTKLKRFLCGRKYAGISAVITMIYFLCVSKRLEYLLLKRNLLDYEEIPIDDWMCVESLFFWVQFSLLIIFITIAIATLVLFRPSKMEAYECRCAFTAAILDLTICFICMGLLISSQVVEKDGGGRLLAGEKTYFESNCPDVFGSILDHGNIEMAMSIIAFRLLRFWAAAYIVKILDSISGRHESLAGEVQGNDDLLPIDPIYGKDYHRKGPHKHSKNHSSIANERGSIVDLWKIAIGRHPDIVEKHGAFSAELLQTMLGIPVISSGNIDIQGVSKAEREYSLSSPNAFKEFDRSIKPSSPKSDFFQDDGGFGSRTESDSESKGKKFSRIRNLNPAINASFSGERKYWRFPKEVQAIILAGKAGAAVYPASLLIGGDQTKSDVDEPGRQMEFKIGKEYFEAGESDCPLLAPDAPLIRNMRRCEHKVLPLLPEWASVDVVMTKFEIVYFDASYDEKDNMIKEGDSDPRTKHARNIREALIATKGGKGLRLRDVSFGRKVVGQEDLNAIESVNIERILSHRSNTTHITLPSAVEEFWKPQKSVLNKPPLKSNNSPDRWMNVTEDRLKIKTMHDVCSYLRFYSDLDHYERLLLAGDNDRPKAEDKMEKNNAMLWCQTIGRIVGASKLNQQLPHYGEKNDEELRDYIITIEEEEDKSNESRWFLKNEKQFKRNLPSRSGASLFRTFSNLGNI